MSLDSCNAFLEAFALLNSGVNHGTSYSLCPLPEAVSLDAALAQYFSLMCTSRMPPHPAESWNIRKTELAGNFSQILTAIAQRWFFSQQYSPKVDKDVGSDIVERFNSYLGAVVGKPHVFKIEISPPMWYECFWEDIAFDSQGRRWLLHFGWSD
jgi:hypothetical protein